MSIIANPQEFFNSLRASPLFGGSLTQEQVEGINALTTKWDEHEPAGLSESVAKSQLAYILGTVYREAGKGMYPVREGFASTDAIAIAHVTSMFNKGQISHNYALPDPVTGKSYFGRGVVQITWASNYKAIGGHIGEDLYHNPDLALDPMISAAIAVRGMMGGWFTGVGLSKYFNDTTNDSINARRIINGTDVATLIAGYAGRFLTSINAAAT